MRIDFGLEFSLDFIITTSTSDRECVWERHVEREARDRGTEHSTEHK